MSPKKAAKRTKSEPFDPIAAFIITAFGKPDAIAEANLRQMAGKFAACQKQFFLFVRRYLDSCKKMALGYGVGLMPPHDYDFSVLKTELYLCIINGELRFGEAWIPFRFPIQTSHAVGELFGKPRLQKGSVFETEYFCGYEVLQLLKQPKKTLDIDLPGLNIAIGDEETKILIRQYQNIISKHYGEFPLLLPVYKMCLLLGRYLTNFPEQAALLESNRELFAKAHQEMGK